MLDKLCAYLVHLVQQPSATADVQAQPVANALLSCYKLRHQPEPAHLSNLLAHFSSLLSVHGRQPTSQAISNVVLATAGLGVMQFSHVMKDLAHGLVATNRADILPQTACNVVWSLAVLDVLDASTFKMFCSIIFSRCHGQLSAQDVTQLYQALYKLQPPSSDSTWDQLRQEVTATLGPLRLTPSQQSPALHAVLQTLQLQHRRDVALTGYKAEAMLQQRAGTGRTMLLVTVSTDDHLTNIPDR